MSKKLKFAVINYENKIIRIYKEIKYINNIPHIECSYLKEFLSIDKFNIRKPKRKSIYYSLEQPSKPGRLKWNRIRYNQKPRKSINKTIDGKLFRFCNELKEYRPIEEFPFKNRYGKKYMSNVCREGKKIENKRNIKSTRKAIKRWKKLNGHKIRLYDDRRRENRKNATPPWIDEVYLKQIQDFYLLRNKLEEETKIKHNVHHIYPLYGTDDKGNHISCGLNVPWNLKVIPAILNLQIGSKNPDFFNQKQECPY